MTGRQPRAASPPQSAPPPPAPPSWGPAPQTASAPDKGPVEQPADSEQHDGETTVAPAKRTVAGPVYAGIAGILIILIIVIDFILQNLKQADIHLFWAKFHLPIGIMVLLGAIGGALAILLISLFFHFQQLRRAKHANQQPVG